MIIDKPLNAEDLFELEDENYLNIMVTFLTSVDNLLKSNKRGSVVIGIIGDWGTGKTTTLRLVESYYRDYYEFPVIFFESWKYSMDGDPVLSLVYSIKEKFYDITRSSIREVLKILSVVSLSLSTSALRIAGVNFDDISKIFTFIESRNLKVVSKSRRIFSLLRESVEEIIKNYKKNKYVNKSLKEKWKKVVGKKGSSPKNVSRKFVIIIDDLDRLVPEKAFEMLEGLRFYFDIDNILIIMGLNDFVINKYVENRYGEMFKGEKEIGERFMDKLFHYTYELKYVELQETHLRSLKKIIKDNNLIENVKDFLEEIKTSTHRKWINVVNRIEENSKNLKNPEGNINYALILDCIMMEFFPSSYGLFSRRYPKLIDILQNLEYDDKNKKWKYPSKFEFVLKDFIDKLLKDDLYLDHPELIFKNLIERWKEKREQQLSKEV